MCNQEGVLLYGKNNRGMMTNMPPINKIGERNFITSALRNAASRRRIRAASQRLS